MNSARACWVWGCPTSDRTNDGRRQTRHSGSHADGPQHRFKRLGLRDRHDLDLLLAGAFGLDGGAELF